MPEGPCGAGFRYGRPTGLGYARVSTAEQDLDRQLDALGAVGIPRERIYLDKKSGATTDRPGLRALLGYARAGDVVVVHTLDRLGRTVRDTLNLVHELAERGVGVRNLADPIRVDSSDPNDPMAQLAVVLLALFGQMERTYALERAAHARSVAAARGRRVGRPSVVDPAKLAWAAHPRDTGHTVAEIVARTGIARTSLYRHLPPRGPEPLTADGAQGRSDGRSGSERRPPWPSSTRPSEASQCAAGRCCGQRSRTACRWRSPPGRPRSRCAPRSGGWPGTGRRGWSAWPGPVAPIGASVGSLPSWSPSSKGSRCAGPARRSPPSPAGPPGWPPTGATQRRATPRCGGSWRAWTRGCWPSPTAGRPPTGTASSWSTAAKPPIPTSSGKPTTPCSTCWSIDEKGRPARPWLTVVVDDRSRAVAGYAVSLGAPSALQTALALRQAVWRKADPAWPVAGLPDVLYSDHGADFTSRHLEQVAADLRVALVHSTPGVPQGRGKVERLFGTVTTELLPSLPGHLPHGWGGTPASPPRLSLAELDAAVGRFPVHEYNRRPHSQTGQAPAERWTAGGWLPRMPDSLEQLDLLLLSVARPRVVHRDGIRFAGLRYLDLTLAAYVGESVTIRFDPRDLAEIRVFHDGRFLCRALAPELAGTTVGLKDVQAAGTARRRALRTQLGERRSLVDALELPGPSGAEPVPPEHERVATVEATSPLRLYRTD